MTKSLEDSYNSVLELVHQQLSSCLYQLVLEIPWFEICCSLALQSKGACALRGWGCLCVMETLGPKHLSCGAEQLNNVLGEGEALASSDCAIPPLVLLFRTYFQLLTSWLTEFRICFDVVDGTYLTCRMSRLPYQLIM